MLRLALRTLRFRLPSFLGAFLAIFAGAAIIMACGGLMETGIRLNAPPERLNAPIVVSSNFETSEQARLSQDTLKKIRDINGVKEAIPDVSFAVDLQEGASLISGLYGHSWTSTAITPYTLIEGRAPAGSRDVVVDAVTAKTANLSAGERTYLTVKGERTEFLVSGIVKTQVAYVKPAFFFEDSFAFSQIDGEQIDAIGVVPVASVDLQSLRHDLEVALAPGPISVLTGDDRGLAEYDGMNGAREVLIAGSAPFGGNTIVVVIFVVASILGLSIRQRTREMALLQTIGATPGQVRRMILIETMVIAIIATGLAIIPGYYLGEFMFAMLKESGLVPAQVLFYQGWLPTLIGIAVGLLSVFASALIASRYATKVQPIEALAELASQKRWFHWAKLIVAIIGLLGGLALALVTAIIMRGAIASSTAGPAVLPWLLAFGLMAPGLIIPLVALLAGPLQLFKRGTGYLAARNIRIRNVQAASMVTPIMLASGMALSMLYQQTTLTDMTRRAYTETLNVGTVIQPRGSGFTTETADSVKALPGVAAASPLIVSEGRFVFDDGGIGEDAFRLEGVQPQGSGSLLNYTVTKGSLENLKGDTIALSDQTAAWLRRNIGDSVNLRLGDGRDTALTLVATYASRAGFENGLVPADTLASHTALGLIPLIGVELQPNVSQHTLQASLNGRAGFEGATVTGGDVISRNIANQTSVLGWVNTLFTVMVTLYALLFLINTLVITITARRREFALQQLIGSTRQEILRMVTLEALAVAVIGVLLGIILSSISLVPFSIAINGTAFPTGSWLILIGVLTTAIVLTVLVSLLTATRALHARPIEVAANRE